MSAFYLSLDTTEPPWDLLLVKGDIKQFVEPCVSSDRFREISRAVPGHNGHPLRRRASAAASEELVTLRRLPFEEPSVDVPRRADLPLWSENSLGTDC